MRNIASAVFFFWAVSAHAQLKLHPLFTDHVVLQRDVPVPVWGTAAKGEKVNVTFQGNTLAATANAKGEWEVKLPATPAGGPFEVTVAGRKERTVLNDVVFGDVWLCSGQSNMEWSVAQSNRFDEEQKAATDAQIRHFKVPRASSVSVQRTFRPADWQAASPQTVGDFTAVGYFFARELRKHHNVSLGLLNSSWGGTRLECWASLQANGYKTWADAKVYHQAEEARRRTEVTKIHGEIPAEDLGFQGGKAVWAAADFDDAQWKTLALPSWFWGDAKENFDGVFWIRKTFDLSAKAVSAEAVLNLGRFSDAASIWLNGTLLDSTSRPTDRLRQFAVPANLLKNGKNVVALRIHDNGGSVGVWNENDEIFLETAAGRIALKGNDWRYRLTKFQYIPEEQFDSAPSVLYNAMIAPLHKFPIKGILWYQGESNAWPMPGAYNYRSQLPQMVADWRKQWGLGDVPFLLVQLTCFGEDPDQPKESNWAVVRESQAVAAQRTPNAAMAVILDVGDPKDVHPRDKQTVGHRLSLAARKLAYGEPVTYQSPAYESMKVDGGVIRLKFKNTGGGLVAKDRYGYLKGFAVAGADKKFHWATARIEGDEVVVSCPSVPKPVAVRYAWANSPDDANLFSKEGLPVGTFRTDEFNSEL
jgi:sialate O-acetylesterase